MLKQFWTSYFPFLRFKRVKIAAEAYNLWAPAYDNQPGNLVLELDDQLFSSFITPLDFTGKTVLDIGCGTGRHWKKVLAKNPVQLLGCDVSEGMLKQLKIKFPEADVLLTSGHHLTFLKNNSCDIILSTLTMAHFKNIEETLAEWNRILKPAGNIIITDYHPEMLVKGGKRTFRQDNKTVVIKNYIHPLGKVRRIAEQLRLREMNFSERKIDESVKYRYEQQQALSLYHQFRDVPLIYAIHFKKEG